MPYIGVNYSLLEGQKWQGTAKLEQASKNNGQVECKVKWLVIVIIDCKCYPSTHCLMQGNCFIGTCSDFF